MTAPLPTLRQARRLFSRPTPREIADRSNLSATESGASGDGELANPQTYRLDNFIEWALSKRGRENTALFLLAFGSIAGIVLIQRYA